MINYLSCRREAASDTIEDAVHRFFLGRKGWWLLEVSPRPSTETRGIDKIVGLNRTDEEIRSAGVRLSFFFGCCVRWLVLRVGSAGACLKF